MLYACFQILVDFIEKEKPQKIVDYDHDAYHRKQWKELQILDKYWKVDRPRLQKEEEKALKKNGPRPIRIPGCPNLMAGPRCMLCCMRIKEPAPIIGNLRTRSAPWTIKCFIALST